MALWGIRPRVIAIVAVAAALLSVLGYVVASSASPGGTISSVQSARHGGSAVSAAGSGSGTRSSLAGAASALPPSISSVQSATGSSWGSNTVSVSLPSGVTAGDLLVAEIATRGGSTTINPPSGWAQAGSLTTYPGTMDTGIFYEVASSSAASFSFTLSGSQAWAVTLREWNSSAGWKSAPLDVTAGSTTGNSMAVDSGTTGTTAQPTELVVAALAWNSAGQSESSLTSGFTSGALGAAGGTISVREAYRVTTATGQFAAQESLSAAEWNASKIAAFLPAQPTVGASPSPSPVPGGASPGPGPVSIGPCVNGLTGSNVISVGGGLYHLQSNEYNSGAAFTLCNDGNADFQVSSSDIDVATDGAPGGYPSVYSGCHWGDCTAGGPLPVQVSALETGGVVSTSFWTTTTGAGAYDDAYDIWFNPARSTGNNSTGLEMMIWLNHNGSVSPAGTEVATGVVIGGRAYNIWKGGPTPGGTVTYQLASPAMSISLDLGPLAADAVARGYMSASWFLIDVEAGFEIWQGGKGLTADAFSVSAG